MAAEVQTVALPRQTPLAHFWAMIRRPRSALVALRESSRPSWIWIALVTLILSILPLLVAAPITARVAAEAIQETMDRQAELGQEITPEMQAQAAQFSTSPIFTMLLPGIARIFGLVLLWLAWSGSLHLLSTITGGSNSFRQMWRAVVWSWIPFALRGLLQTVFILATGELITRPGLSALVAPNETGAGAESALQIPGTGELFLSGVLGQIDLFVVWNLILLVLSVEITARISRRKSILITLGVWVVLVLLSVLPALVTGTLSRGMTGL